MPQLALARAVEERLASAARSAAAALRGLRGRQKLSDDEVKKLAIEAARRLGLNVSNLHELHALVKGNPRLRAPLAEKVKEVYREQYLGVAHAQGQAKSPTKISGHSVVGRALRLGGLVGRLRVSLGFEGADLEHAKMLSEAFDAVARRVGAGNPFSLLARYHSSRSFRAKVDAAVSDAIAGIKDEGLKFALLKFREAGGNPLELMAMAKLGLLGRRELAGAYAAHAAKTFAAHSPHLAGAAARLMAAPLLEILRQVPGMSQVAGHVASVGDASRAFFERMSQNLAAFSEEWRERLAAA